jgi:hypothetical protein
MFHLFICLDKSGSWERDRDHMDARCRQREALLRGKKVLPEYSAAVIGHSVVLRMDHSGTAFSRARVMAIYGNDITQNNVKRIYAKSESLIQITDQGNEEAITSGTPKHNVLTPSEKHDATGRPQITLESTRDTF